ncbi:hypothetical protein D3C71_417100 [compost metagenome]
MVLVELDRLFDDDDLAGHQLAMRTGAWADPVFGLAAIQRQMDGCGDRGVADAHFAEAQEIGATGNRFHAERHGRSAIALGKSRFGCNVTGRIIERKVENLQAQVMGDADLVDCRTACGKIIHHLLRHGRREGCDAMPGDTVIAGEDRNKRAVDRRCPARPSGKPEGDFLKPSKRSERLCQLGVTLAGIHQCAWIRSRQVGNQVTKIVERQAAQTHRNLSRLSRRVIVRHLCSPANRALCAHLLIAYIGSDNCQTRRISSPT